MFLAIDIDWGRVMKYVLFFFVVVAPIAKGIIESQRQKREAEAKRRAQGEPAPETDEGRQRWNELERGTVSAEPPPVPRPVPLPVPVSRRVDERSLEERSHEDQPQRPLVELESSLPSTGEFSASDRELEFESEPNAEALVTRRERAEEQRQTEIVRAEYDASSPYRADVAPISASAVAPSTQVEQRARTRGAADRWLFPDQPDRDPRAAVRRAIVLREVFGPPVSLH